MNLDKFMQWFGAILYAGAAAVAGGGLDGVLNSHYAWVPALLGGVLRNLSDSNSSTITK
jgi:hypothetical protein